MCAVKRCVAYSSPEVGFPGVSSSAGSLLQCTFHNRYPKLGQRAVYIRAQRGSRHWSCGLGSSPLAEQMNSARQAIAGSETFIHPHT